MVIAVDDRALLRLFLSGFTAFIVVETLPL